MILLSVRAVDPQGRRVARMTDFWNQLISEQTQQPQPPIRRRHIIYTRPESYQQPSYTVTPSPYPSPSPPQPQPQPQYIPPPAPVVSYQYGPELVEHNSNAQPVPFTIVKRSLPPPPPPPMPEQPQQYMLSAEQLSNYTDEQLSAMQQLPAYERPKVGKLGWEKMRSGFLNFPQSQYGRPNQFVPDEVRQAVPEEFVTAELILRHPYIKDAALAAGLEWLSFTRQEINPELARMALQARALRNETATLERILRAPGMCAAITSDGIPINLTFRAPVQRGLIDAICGCAPYVSEAMRRKFCMIMPMRQPPA